MITKLTLFFLMFAIIGNAPEMVQGARIVNCANLPANCCRHFPSAYGCENYIPNFGFRSLAQLGGPQNPDLAMAQVQTDRINSKCYLCWLCGSDLICWRRCVTRNCCSNC